MRSVSGSPGASLLVTYRGKPLLELALEGASLAVGTGEDNDLRLGGRGVEPHHLVLRRRGLKWVAVARGGEMRRQGGGPVSRRIPLSPGTSVSFGEFTLQVVAGGGEDSRSSTSTLAEQRGGRRRPELSVLAPRGSRYELHALGEGGATIGRDASCDISADDPYMSQLHARILPVPGAWVVVDQGSLNGTRLEGRLVDSAEVAPGSSLVVGRTLLQLVETGPGGSDRWLVTPGLGQALAEVERCATTSLPVLLVGESGAGKEGLACRLHERSSRSGGPFVPVNCGALPEGLADSLLFGHVRGAFTGAHEEQEGLVRASSGGTLFLDEVGELSAAVQARLLRVLEEGVVRPLGSSLTHEVDLRIVAATHRDLRQAVHEGDFRLDLFHRLAVLAVEVPPLRRRTGDIGLLAGWMLERGEVRAAGISPEALELLRSYGWPGNVRELRNVLSRAALRCGGGIILPSHLVFLCAGDEAPRRPAGLPASVSEARTLLARAQGNVTQAARLAGVARSTFRDQLRRLGLGGPSPSLPR